MLDDLGRMWVGKAPWRLITGLMSDSMWTGYYMYDIRQIGGTSIADGSVWLVGLPGRGLDVATLALAQET